MTRYETTPKNKHKLSTVDDLAELMVELGYTPGKIYKNQHIKCVTSVETKMMSTGSSLYHSPQAPMVTVTIDATGGLSIRRND